MKTGLGNAIRIRAPKAESIRSFLLGMLSVYFLYRYLSLGTGTYLVFVATLLIVLVAGVTGVLALKWQNLSLNLAISLLFLDLVFYRIDFQAMFQAVTGLNYLFLVPSTAFLVLAAFVRAWRWGWLLRSSKPVPFVSLLSALSIGVAANMVLPARAGEFIRAYILGRRENLSKTTVFATVVLERIFDGLTVLLFLLLVVSFFIGTHVPEIQYMGVAGALFYVGAIGGLVLVYNRVSWLESLLGKVLPAAFGSKLIGLIRAFAEGLESIRNFRQLAAIVLSSLLFWSVIAASFWPVLKAFDFGPPVPLYTPFLLVATLSLALMIPAAPAGIGLFQYACFLTLRIVFAPYAATLVAGFDERVAAFSLVVHLSQAVPEILMGLIFFFYEGFSLQEVNSSI